MNSNLKVLIIDNHMNQTNAENISKVIKSFCECKIIKFNKIKDDFHIGSGWDAIVLTGSDARIVRLKDVNLFNGVINLIKNVDIPVLGICYGHQLMCLALGAKVKTLKDPVINTFEKVHIINLSEIFHGFMIGQKICLAEWHNDFVRKDSLQKAGFELLADSNSCETEAVKHRNKPFFGVQFHPELTRIDMEEHKEGQQIIENFFKRCC